MSFGAGIGAAYRVMVDFGIRNTMAPGMRSVQMQMAGLQTHLARTRKMTEEQAVAARRYAPIYQQIYGNPRTYKETRDNMDRLAAHKKRLESRLAQSTDPAEQARLASRVSALNAVNSDLQARGRIFNISRRQNAEDARAAKLAARERSAQILHRKKILTMASTAGFKTMEYAGMGGLGILGGLGYTAYQAAGLQQHIATTAMALALPKSMMAAAGKSLFDTAVSASMDVAYLSPMDVAGVQSQIARHMTLQGPGGLRTLQSLTLPIVKFADVMKNLSGGKIGVEDSARVGILAANVFGDTTPKKLMRFLNSFWRMEQQTGVDPQRALTALSYFGQPAHLMGMSQSGVLQMYSEAYRLGIGAGKSGQRLGALIRKLGDQPTTVKTEYAAKQLGLINQADMPVYLHGGKFDLVTFLENMHVKEKAFQSKYGKSRGFVHFKTLFDLYFGAQAGQTLLPLVQSGSIQQMLSAHTKNLKEMSIDRAQAYYLHLPMGEFVRFKTNFKALVLMFGEYGLPLFKQMFKQLADTMQSWTNNLKKHPHFMVKLFKGLAEFGVLLLGIAALGGIVSVVAKVIEVFGWISGAAATVAAFLGLPVWAVVVAAIALIVLAIMDWKRIISSIMLTIITWQKIIHVAALLFRRLGDEMRKFMAVLGLTKTSSLRENPKGVAAAFLGGILGGPAMEALLMTRAGLSHGTPGPLPDKPVQIHTHIHLNQKEIAHAVTTVQNKVLRGAFHGHPSSGKSSVLMPYLENGGFAVPGGVR